MVDVKEYGDYETAWCPGCGNFLIIKALKRALAEMDLPPHRVMLVSGIGQAAKLPHYMNANMFNGLHGRSLPVATGIKLVNEKLKVIVSSGDGCNYAEGGNHLLGAIRRNIDVTLLVHDNQVYGLTKGQASPTSCEGFVTKAQPFGALSTPFNAVAVAVAMKAGMAARSFAGMEDHLVDTIKKAVMHKGFSLVDVLQPCVSYNHVNTFQWYRERCKPLPADYDPTDWENAMKTSQIWGDKIPVGVIYRNDGKSFEDRLPEIEKNIHIEKPTDKKLIKTIMDGYL